jgi:DNA-binding NarL/FixJ family response regulator
MRTSVDALAREAAEHGRGSVSVLVVHDEEIVHFGWRLLLSRHQWVSRCIAARDKHEAVDLIDRYAPAVAIVDLDVGYERATAMIAALVAASPRLFVLLVSGTTTISAKAASYIGATGVVRKSLSADDLANAVRAVASGKRLFAISTPAGASWLSDREKEVLRLMAAGATNREIASELCVSTETTKRHAANIFRKLDVRNRTEAAQRGRELGLTVQPLSREPVAAC